MIEAVPGVAPVVVVVPVLPGHRGPGVMDEVAVGSLSVARSPPSILACTAMKR